MRNLIIYELEADYANYLQSLGRAEPARAQVRVLERRPARR